MLGSSISDIIYTVDRQLLLLQNRHTELKMAISYETPAFTIPVVDISPYLRNPQSVEAEQVVEQIRAACVTSGFFQITGHGISEALQDQIFSAAKTLFALPEDDKRKLAGKPGRGYEIIGSQILEAGKKPDLKEVSSPIVGGQFAELKWFRDS
jgi:hypothetical protein